MISKRLIKKIKKLNQKTTTIVTEYVLNYLIFNELIEVITTSKKAIYSNIKDCDAYLLTDNNGNIINCKNLSLLLEKQKENEKMPKYMARTLAIARY